MSNYVKATNFAVKDGLTTGDSAKRVKGTEIDSEFNAIASAISSKADADSPTLTGTPSAPTATAGTNNTQIATTAFVTAATASAITASSTNTLTNKTISADDNTLSGIAASSFVVSNASGNIDGSAAQKAIPSGVVVGTTDTQTLTNKTVALGSNTVSGTKAQFNTAVTDTDFSFINDFTGTNQNKATNGYQKLPGGLIIQWGSQTNNTNSGNVTFPVEFPSACVSVQATFSRNSETLYAPVISSITKTGFSQIAYDTNSTIKFYWLAVGY